MITNFRFGPLLLYPLAHNHRVRRSIHDTPGRGYGKKWLNSYLRLTSQIYTCLFGLTAPYPYTHPAVHWGTQLHPTKKKVYHFFPSLCTSTSLSFSSIHPPTLAELPSTWYQSSPPLPLPTQQDKTKFKINPPLYILPKYKLIKPGPKLN